ncbi:hypothetical protein OIV83_004573 [Microbotryomycetes sp. JL201]|nr:hypothetical protein OIV83_004573 [Microbotryomycetes sp. JL201]
MSSAMFELRRRSSVVPFTNGRSTGHVKVELEPLTTTGSDSGSANVKQSTVRAWLWLSAGTFFCILLYVVVCTTSILTTSSSWTPIVSRLLYRARPAGFGDVRLPQWHDFDRIRKRTKQCNGVVKQVKLGHLADHRVRHPFREVNLTAPEHVVVDARMADYGNMLSLAQVYVTSAWLDTRPLVVSNQLPQLTLLASIQGREHMEMPSGLFKHNELKCYIVMRDLKTGLETVLVEDSQLQGLPDPHEWEVDLVSVKFSCPVKGDWQDAEIFATLSTAHIAPPSDTFVSVTALPTLDTSQHISGKGSAAVCVPALIGDLYAPLLADFVAYYRTLGFSQIYAYLLDPGRNALDQVARLGKQSSNSGVTPIRFGLHKNLKTSFEAGSSTYAVPPSDWNIDGIDVLDGDDEFELAGMANGNAQSVRTWYFGQGLALHDCQYRAMKDGHRWLMAVDWDEFVVLKPGAKNNVWPPLNEVGRGGNVALLDWLNTARTRWTWPFTIAWKEAVEQLGVDVTNISQRNFPSAFMFQSTFACIRCTPSTNVVPDLESTSVQALSRLVPDVANSQWTQPGPGLFLPMLSPVRMKNWFPQNFRSKAMVDPWAWWSLGIHSPGVGFAEWMVQRGPCSSTFSPDGHGSRLGSSDAQCAKLLVEAFAWGTALVAVPDSDPVSPSEDVAKFGMSSDASSSRATGALYHFRVDSQMSRAMTRFYAESQVSSSSSMDVLDGGVGVQLVGHSRVAFQDSSSQYGDTEIELVQDWTMLETMGHSLVPVLVAKRALGPFGWISDTNVFGSRVRVHPTSNVRKYALIAVVWSVGAWWLVKLWCGKRSRATLLR